MLISHVNPKFTALRNNNMQVPFRAPTHCYVTENQLNKQFLLKV